MFSISKKISLHFECDPSLLLTSPVTNSNNSCLEKILNNLKKYFSSGSRVKNHSHISFIGGFLQFSSQSRTFIQQLI